MKVKLKVLWLQFHTMQNCRYWTNRQRGLDVIARDELLEMLREFLEKDEERSILISSLIYPVIWSRYVMTFI